MITWRFWTTERKDTFYRYERLWSGYFLFGIIPVYIQLDKETKFQRY